jgi:serine/threonine-protein kinase SRPK3
MLDKLAFGMSKIDGEGSKPGSVGSAGPIPRETRSEMKERAGDVGSGNETDEAADRLSNMSIDSNGFDKKSKPHPSNPPDRHYSPRWRHPTLERRYPARIPGPRRRR